MTQTYGNKTPWENRCFTADFRKLMGSWQANEVIVSVVSVTLTMVQGVDPNPNAMLNGAPLIGPALDTGALTVAGQWLKGGIAGCVYLVSYKVNTNIQEGVEGQVLLPVVART